jgi:hypothetical protein
VPGTQQMLGAQQVPPPWVPETVAGDSADAGSLVSEMRPEEANTDWAPVFRSVFDLAR